MQLTKDLSIIIVNYNVSDLLINCINSINRYEAKLATEIFVIDNNSAESEQKKLEEYARRENFKVIFNKKNVGFAAANNQVLDQVCGKFVVFLNPDTEIKEENSLKRMVDFLEASPQVGICGPRILFGDNSLQLSCGTFPTPYRLLSEILFFTRLCPKIFPGYRYPNWKHDRQRYVDWVSGACFFIRTDLLSKLNGFDDALIFYIEDIDLCHRARLEGYKIVYEPAVEILHYEGQSSRKTRETAVISGYISRLKFYKKYYGDSYVFIVKLGFIISSLIKIILLFPMRFLRPGSYRPIFQSYWIALKKIINEK